MTLVRREERPFPGATEPDDPRNEQQEQDALGDPAQQEPELSLPLEGEPELAGNTRQVGDEGAEQRPRGSRN